VRFYVSNSRDFYLLFVAKSREQNNNNNYEMIFESEKILSHFPPVEFAFAYGSGAIKQGSYDYNLPKGYLLAL